MTIRVKPQPADEPFFQAVPQTTRKTRWMIVDSRYLPAKKIIAKNIRIQATAELIAKSYNFFYKWHDAKVGYDSKNIRGMNIEGAWIQETVTISPATIKKIKKAMEKKS